MSKGDGAAPLPPPSPTRGVWLDVDPGHDDAMAIILAYRHSKYYSTGSLEVLGASTCAGNQTVEKTSLNFQRIVNLIGEETRCIPGAAEPLLRRSGIGSPDCKGTEIHGESGLGGAVWPQPETVLEPDVSSSAVHVMEQRISEYYRR